MRCRTFATLVVCSLVACSGGRDKMLADLQSPRPEVRAQAVKRLANHFQPDDVSLFSQAARDPMPAVRAEAMTALGKTQDSRVVDLLGEALGDSDEQVQQVAAAALASFKIDKARDYLRLQYSRRGRTTRMAIVKALKGANIPGAMAAVVSAEAKTLWERNLKVLADGALPERIGAAEELGRSGRTEAVNRLVPLLKDKHVALAAAAARGLGLAADVRAVPALTALLEENYPELRDAACEALGRLAAASSLPQLLAVAKEGSRTSAVATRAIMALPPSPEVMAALCTLLVSGNSAEVLTAGRELRKRGGCEVEPIIEKLKNPSTATVGLLALVALAPQGDFGARVGVLTTSADDETRRLAVEALAELGDAASIPFITKAWEAELKAMEPRRLDWLPQALPLVWAPGFDPQQETARDDPSAILRTRTTELFAKVQALDAQRVKEAGKIGLEAKAPREIIDDVSEDEVRVLCALLRALGKLKIEGASSHAHLFILETSPSLRAAAFSALALLGEDARPGLFDTERSVQGATAQALVESGPAGQLVVLEALGSLGGDRLRLVEPLRAVIPPSAGTSRLEQLAKEGGAEAGAAAMLLGEMGAKSAVPVLINLLEEQDQVARRAVLFSLGLLGDARAAEAVTRDLYSDSAEVRSAAVLALAQLKVRTQLEAIEALKGDYNLQVRNSAVQALEALAATGTEEKR